MSIKDRDVIDRVIYALIFSTHRICYVGHTPANNHYAAYKEHVRGRKMETAPYFGQLVDCVDYPKMYHLTTIAGTAQQAYRYRLAWYRYFADQGYQLIAYPKTIAYLHDLLPDTEAIYSAIKDTPIKHILTTDRLLVSKYEKRNPSKESSKRSISMSVSPREYALIQQRAQARGQSMSAYCKDQIQCGRIINIPSPETWYEMALVNGANYRLRQVCENAVDNHGAYTSTDLEEIESCVAQILEASNSYVTKLMTVQEEVEHFIQTREIPDHWEIS